MFDMCCSRGLAGVAVKSNGVGGTCRAFKLVESYLQNLVRYSQLARALIHPTRSQLFLIRHGNLSYSPRYGPSKQLVESSRAPISH